MRTIAALLPRGDLSMATRPQISVDPEGFPGLERDELRQAAEDSEREP